MAQNIDPSEVQQALGGLDYPASKEELVQRARDNAAEDQVINFLERIEEGNYESPIEVQEELNKMGDLNDTDQAA